MNMTKASVKRALGLRSDADLARFFGIGRAAVGFWAENESIPKTRQWELCARRPDIFGPDAAPVHQAGSAESESATDREVSDAA